MTLQTVPTNFRPIGVALLLVTIFFTIGAFSAAYFRPPIPTDPFEKLSRIANDKIGWTAQAIIFPVSFLAITIIFGRLIGRLPDGLAQWLAIAATILSAAAFLLWLPISINRLHLGSQAAELMRNFDPATPTPVIINFDTFWLYTLCALAGIGLMGAALAVAGMLPTVGWLVVGVTAVAALVGGLVWGDWPPFMTYIILLVLAIGLLRSG